MRNEEEEKEEQHNHHKILVLRNVNENNDKEELFAFEVLSEELRRVNLSTLGLSNEDHTVGLHDLQLDDSTRVIVQVHRSAGLRIIDSNSKSVSQIALGGDNKTAVTHSYSISSHLHLRFQSGAIQVFAMSNNSKNNLVELVEISKKVPNSISSSMFRCSLSMKCEKDEDIEMREMKNTSKSIMVTSDSESED